MVDIIDVTDLPESLQSVELVDVMVAGANAKASRVAPCLSWDGSDSTKPEPSEGQIAEAKLILIGAVKRWAEAGSGAVSTKSTMTGPYMTTETVDTKQRTGYNLWPSEIAQLQELCKTGGTASAFSVDTAPCAGGGHLPWCSINFGAGYCSCGVDIAWEPIYELG